MMVVALVLLTSMTATRVASAAFPLFAFGSAGAADGQFQFPQGIAVDAARNSYVADTENHRIQKFDPAGNFLLTFGAFGSGPGQFNHPQGVAVDDAGNIYVNDQGNFRIQKFNSSGTFLSVFAFFGNDPNSGTRSPLAIAVDSANNVWVGRVFHLEKFDPSGNLVVDLTSLLAGGPGIIPTAIGFDDSGNVVIWEKDNGTVDKFDLAGNLLLRFGSTGCVIATGFGCTTPSGLALGDGQFSPGGSTGIAIDRLGYIYVVDPGNDRVQKFSPSGDFLLKFGAPGSALGQFLKPTGIALASSGRILVADSSNHRIQVFAGPVAFAASATGMGPVTFETSAGGFRDLEAVSESTLPTAGKPAGVTFPFGFFSWTVTNLAPGQSITVTITSPSNVASPAEYWKVIGGSWTDVASLVGDDDGDEVLTLTITDGGLGDADGAANGQISDPGGLGLAADGGGGSTLAFLGFQPPIREQALNTGRKGRTYPVKFQVQDASGHFVGDLSAVRSITAEPVSCDTLVGDVANELVAAATGGTSLRYDAGANHFVFSWKTPDTAGCYRLRVTLADGGVYAATFQLN
jgi:sugar lactone lactonase YvrE